MILKSQKGYTLLELLVTIGLLAVVCLCAYKVFDFTHKTYKAQAAQSNASGDLRGTMDMILTELRKSGARCVNDPEDDDDYFSIVTYGSITKYIFRTKTDGEDTEYEEIFAIWLDGSTLRVEKYDGDHVLKQFTISEYIHSFDFAVDTVSEIATITITSNEMVPDLNGNKTYPYKLQGIHYFRDRNTH